MRSVGYCARVIPFLIVGGVTSGCGGDSSSDDLLLSVPPVPTPAPNTTILQPTPTPAPPRVTATVATDAAGNPEVTVTWQPRPNIPPGTSTPPGDVVEYHVTREYVSVYPEERPGVVIGALPPTTTQYVDNDSLAGQTISYIDIIQTDEVRLLGDIIERVRVPAVRKQIVPPLTRDIPYTYRVTALIRLPPNYGGDYIEVGVAESEPITVPAP